MVGPLKVTVISPTVTTLDKLIKAWKKQLGKDGGIVSSEVETKIQNLSSIVVLVESGTKKMLLTGDALDNDFLDDLDQLGFLDSNGQIRVDVLKLPHHGSKVNNHDRLFETIKAKHYVISADGRFDNPDPPTLERFVRSEKDRACTLWITNGPGEGGSMGKVLDSRYRKLDTPDLRAQRDQDQGAPPEAGGPLGDDLGLEGLELLDALLLCGQRRDLDGPADVKIDVAVVEDLGLREIEGDLLLRGLHGAPAARWVP